jgi:Dolichyl-phosphate-mannose-protein mannosyltransferase
MDSGAGRDRAWALEWALPVVLAAGALAVAAAGLLTLMFDWELYVGESINSYFADQMFSSGELYRDWSSQSPYFPVYPPGFYAMAAPLQLLDPDAVWPGRVIACAGFLLAGLSSWKIARRFGCTPAEALSAALGFLLISVTGLLVASARPDGIGIGLIGASLWAITRWEDDRAKASLYWAAALSAAFMLVKYNFAPIAAGMVVAIWLRDRRSAAIYTISAAVIVVAGFALAELLTGPAIANTRDFGIGYSLSSLSEVLDQIFLPVPNPFIVVALLEVGVAFALREKLRAVHLAWIGAMIVILSAVKIGSSVNYVAPAALASSILVGPALMRLRLAAGKPIAGLVSLGLALMLVPLVQERVRGIPSVRTELQAIDAANQEAVSRLAVAPGEIFGDRNDLSIAAGHGPSFDNAAMTLLAESGEWDTGELVASIEQGELGMIQTGFDVNSPASSDATWPPELVAAIRTSYCEVWQTTVRSSTGSGIWLYEPCNVADG